MVVADALVSLDGALVRLRRLWSAPRRMLIDDTGRHVEMSSVLVVEACALGAVRDVEVGVNDVAEFTDVAPSTASRLVDRAVRAGLVHRTSSPRDSRRSALTLTPAGEALRNRAVTTRLAWLAAVVDDWDDADRDTLAGLLGRFAESVASTAEDPRQEN